MEELKEVVRNEIISVRMKAEEAIEVCNDPFIASKIKEVADYAVKALEQIPSLEVAHE